MAVSSARARVEWRAATKAASTAWPKRVVARRSLVNACSVRVAPIEIRRALAERLIHGGEDLYVGHAGGETTIPADQGAPGGPAQIESPDDTYQLEDETPPGGRHHGDSSDDALR